MNKFLVGTFAVLLITTGAGCESIGSTPVERPVVVEKPVAKPDTTEQDNFAKKKECAKYLDSFRANAKKNSDEAGVISNQWVCFSEDRNTCAGFDEQIDLPANGKDGYKTYTISDLLTNEVLGFNFASFKDRTDYELDKQTKINQLKCVK